MRKHLYWLGKTLSPFSNRLPDADWMHTGDWQRLAFLADNYLVTPSLAYKLEQAELMDKVPEVFRLHFREIAANVKLRNDKLRIQLIEIVSAFETAQINYTVLKGGTYLLADIYPTHFHRVMGDLDILVAERDVRRAKDLLHDAGYTQPAELALHKPGDQHRHLDPFIHPSHLVAVEIHTAALPERLHVRCGDAEFLETAQRHNYGETDHFLALAPTMKILNLILHCELIDHGYHKGIIPMRSLEEYAFILSAEGDQVDWELLKNRFSRIGKSHILESFLFFSYRMLDAPLPTEISDARFSRHQRHHFRCFVQLESRFADRWLKRIFFRYSKSVLEEQEVPNARPGAIHRARFKRLLKSARRGKNAR